MLRLFRSRADRPRAPSGRHLAAGAALAAALLVPSLIPGGKPHRNGTIWVAAGPPAKIAVPATADPRLGSGLLVARATLPPQAGWPREPLAAGFVPAAVPQSLAAAAPPASAEPGRMAAAALPLPVSRPAAPARPAVTAFAEEPARRTRRARATPPAPMAETRSFFAELFGLDAEPTPPPALAYAALDGAPLPTAPRPRISPSPAPEMQAGVAIYDIRARTVTLPNGERLEAHSGLGDKIDDPDFAHIRMKGATPPGTYDLTEREALFHGVRAIRMNPVGGSGAIHGRAGILAHTYMLGPRGDSNGCMSVRDYDRFLQAFLRGEIRRVVVVAGEGPSGAIGGLFGGARRS